MKFWKAVLPNLTIALNLALMIVIYLDMRNPMMGFLIGTPFRVLTGACAICSIATAVVLYACNRRNNRHKRDEVSANQ
jgi:mannose/fructose/N-acetylgalactosamine-specific phosphotransferase system component IIC